MMFTMFTNRLLSYPVIVCHIAQLSVIDTGLGLMNAIFTLFDPSVAEPFHSKGVVMLIM